MNARPEPAGDPEISVIIIFLNEELYLADAIESVLAQRGCDWELLLVDDGSTDGSPEIAKRHAAAYPDRIRYVTEDRGGPRGMSAARNLGISRAQGRWLTFLDADDLWREGKLAAQLDALARHPDINVLASPAQWWNNRSDGDDEDWVQALRPLSASGRPGRNETDEDEVVVEAPGLLIDFLDDEWQSICDLVVNRATVDAVGGYEASFRGMYEDQVFHAKVLSRHAVLVTGQWWYRYRQHPDACTAGSHRAGSHLMARRRYLDWLARHLDGTDFDETELARTVRSHRRRAHYPRLTRLGGRVRRILAMP